MKQSVYNRHSKAFKQMSAYVVIKHKPNAEFIQVARIAFKHCESTTYCYFDLTGQRMVLGSASGYGYDKAAAAFDDAVEKALAQIKEQKHYYISEQYTVLTHLKNASQGLNFDHKFPSGYTVLQAV